jgi:hypothetical protein
MRFVWYPLAAVGLFASALCALFLLVISQRPAYDTHDPDYDRVATAFRELDDRWRSTGWDETTVLDVTALNGGDWTTACLFGGYTRPGVRIAALGATVRDSDLQRTTETSGSRLAPVEEQEVMLAYIREDGQARFIHFARGVGPDGQHMDRCVTKPATAICLDPNLPAAATCGLRESRGL